MKKIDKIVNIIKNKTTNTILVLFWLLSLIIIAFVDQHFPKAITKQIVVPVFILMGIVGVIYLIMFILIRVWTKKEKDVCPKCGSSFIGDIGFDNWQCYDCDHTWKKKSKTGLE